MTLKERRERKFEAFRIGMEREKEERTKLEAEGDTFMLGLMDIQESEDPDNPTETLIRQLRLILAEHDKRRMAKTGICPCCGQTVTEPPADR